MLQRLKIENFVLMKTCETTFSAGLNIITGETGAGKSVLLSALELLLGGRVDGDAIRHGEEKASIEGEFLLRDIKSLKPLFDEYEVDLSSEITLRRELFRHGKHKSFLNEIPVQTAFIKAVAPFLLDHYNQETCFQLRSPSFALQQIDLFANTRELQKAFSTQWTEYQADVELYKKLQNEESYKEIEIEQLNRDIHALESLSLEDLDDTALFDIYQKGIAHQKMEEKYLKIRAILDTPSSGLLAKVQQAESLSDECEPSLVELLTSARISLQEASYWLEQHVEQDYLSHEMLEKIEKRLSLFDTLKRKYVQETAQELIETLKEKKTRREELQKRGELLQELKTALKEKKIKIDAMAQELSLKRKTASKELEQQIEQRIRLMNMPEATFHISYELAPRSSSGDDTCLFTFVPNPGEKIVNVHTGASNGELARIFLALSSALSNKEKKSTILFDEIDANIGGMTARAVGHLLQEISKEKQILAITHFAQVAESADSHFVLSKEVMDKRTITSITKLTSASERKKELHRMIGKASM